jgi:hypothetical protein
LFEAGGARDRGSRGRRGGGRPRLEPRREIEAALGGDGFVAPPFHPFLPDDDERFAVLRHPLERVRELCAVACRDVRRAARLAYIETGRYKARWRAGRPWPLP